MKTWKLSSTACRYADCITETTDGVEHVRFIIDGVVNTANATRLVDILNEREDLKAENIYLLKQLSKYNSAAQSQKPSSPLPI